MEDIIKHIQSTVRNKRMSIDSLACEFAMTTPCESNNATCISMFHGEHLIFQQATSTGRHSYYSDGKKGYDIKDDTWQDKKINHARVNSHYGTRSQHRPTIMHFCYGNFHNWLDELLEDDLCRHLGEVHDDEHGLLHKLQVPDKTIADKTFTFWVAEKYDFAIVRLEGENTPTGLRVNSDFQLAGGYWLPGYVSLTPNTGSDDGPGMQFKFSNIRVNTVAEDEVMWRFPVGSVIEDNGERVKYRLEESGEWVVITAESRNTANAVSNDLYNHESSRICHRR